MISLFGRQPAVTGQTVGRAIVATAIFAGLLAWNKPEREGPGYIIAVAGLYGLAMWIYFAYFRFGRRANRK